MLLRTSSAWITAILTATRRLLLRAASTRIAATLTAARRGTLLRTAARLPRPSLSAAGRRALLASHAARPLSGEVSGHGLVMRLAHEKAVAGVGIGRKADSR
jgi:hypothetical protein